MAAWAWLEIVTTRSDVSPVIEAATPSIDVPHVGLDKVVTPSISVPHAHAELVEVVMASIGILHIGLIELVTPSIGVLCIELVKVVLTPSLGVPCIECSEIVTPHLGASPDGRIANATLLILFCPSSMNTQVLDIDSVKSLNCSPF